MTSSIRVFHTGGNKALKVIIEVKIANVESENSVPGTIKWAEQQTYYLWQPGNMSEEIWVYDNQRVRVEETGDFYKEDMAQNNVIQFPVNRIAYPARVALNTEQKPQAVNEIKDVYQLLKIKKAEEIMEVLLPLIAQGFLAYGITLNDKTNSRNISFMVESIRSTLHGHFGLEHPFQQLATNVFVEHEGKIILKPLHVQSANVSNSNSA